MKNIKKMLFIAILLSLFFANAQKNESKYLDIYPYAGYNLPQSDFNNFAENGKDYGLALDYYLSPKLAIGIDVNRRTVPTGSNPNTFSERAMYSIKLKSDGSFPIIGSEIVEFTNIMGNSKVISDIAFSSDFNEMLVTERGHPHSAFVMSYTRSSTSWSFNKQYFVSGSLGNNSAGGVDFSYKEKDGKINDECDAFFWASANAFKASNVSAPLNSTSNWGIHLYGIEGINYSGNNSSASVVNPNLETDLFIDFDGSGTLGVKSSIGDVEVFDVDECFDFCNY